MSLNPADRQLSDDDLRVLFGGDIRLREPVAYYLDENMMEDALIDNLRTEGIAVTTVAERGLAGHPSDFVVLADARRIGCVFVTFDVGYELLHARLLQVSETGHAGILLMSGDMSFRAVEVTLLRVVEKALDYPAVFYASQLVKFG